MRGGVCCIELKHETIFIKNGLRLFIHIPVALWSVTGLILDWRLLCVHVCMGFLWAHVK